MQLQLNNISQTFHRFFENISIIHRKELKDMLINKDSYLRIDYDVKDVLALTKKLLYANKAYQMYKDKHFKGYTLNLMKCEENNYYYYKDFYTNLFTDTTAFYIVTETFHEIVFINKELKQAIQDTLDYFIQQDMFNTELLEDMNIL